MENGKILALWSTPRSTSTAFEWAMSNRGDMLCFHEPYNEAYYHGEDRRNDRYFADDPAPVGKSGLSMSSVHRKLQDLSASRVVFIKDFAYSVMHMADDRFLDAFVHTFLIRDPEKVITSMYSKWPDIELDELGFEDMHTLFRRVADRQGHPPPVIDSDELLDNPQIGMEAYCRAVGIPFRPESLNWNSDREESTGNNPTWNPDAEGFHDRLKTSSGLSKQPRNYPSMESSEEMLRLYRASIPHYRALFSNRLHFGSGA
ncbi:MAG: sulfotransferase family protein [Gammaproteobacteria bacterium]|nr:sulfotransferase family protein [Gammaproteobacteria bacterium]MYD76654.1 sulfotransferase family protein [Gammaproteobacteria bacterium]MYJ52697.1 sulfotransferase family protein [Gammaproteobacteria bacterium]